MTADLSRAMLPEAVEHAERGLLGAVLLQPSNLKHLPDLEVDHFAHMKHRAVFSAFRTLEASNKPISVLSVELEVERLGKLDAIGGVAFLGDLAMASGAAGTEMLLQDLERVVRDFALKRKVMLACGDLVERARQSEISGDDLLTEATNLFASIDGIKADTVANIGDWARRRIDQLDQIAADRAAGKPALTGFPTGVHTLDLKLGGWQPGIVNLIAARPAMGKSSLALATTDACSENAVGVHVFTLEDSWSAYTDRALARRSGVPAVQLRRAEVASEDASPLMHATARLVQRQGWLVDDRGGLTASEIVRAARRSKDANKTRVVVVDYIQLVKPRDARMTEYQHLGDASRTFATAAKLDDVAYLVLCQLNRDIEKRDDKRPRLSDLRGSGELEEHCKIAVGLYRGSYYGGKPKRDVDYECNCEEGVRSCKAHAPTPEEWETQAQCCVIKGGNGPTGVVMANWHGPTTRIW